MKNLLTIVLISLATCFTAQSQSRPAGPDPAEQVRVVRFYPNPATTFIIFEFNKTAERNYNFQVFNFLGQKVFETNSVSNKSQINLTDFTRGIYIFQLRNSNGKVVQSGKFQVSK